MNVCHKSVQHLVIGVVFYFDDLVAPCSDADAAEGIMLFGV